GNVKSSKGKWNNYIILIIILIILIVIAFIFQEKIAALFNNDSENNVEILNEVKSENEDPVPSILNIAERHLINGRLDSAVVSFKLILADNPMHIGALNGIDIVASEYIRLGNLQRDQKKYNEALVYYYNAAELKPGDNNIAGLIAVTKNDLNSLSKNQRIVTTTENKIIQTKQPGIIQSEPDENIVFASFKPSEWDFNALNENDFQLDQQGLTFYNSSKSKTGLYNQIMEDVDVNVRVALPANSSDAKAGIIIGYNFEAENQKENYFLFTADVSGGFKLLRRSGDSEETLVSVYRKMNPIQNKYNFNLKIKSLGPWIMIYNDDKLLESWLGKEFVKGKLGLYAFDGTHAEFSDFKVTTAFKKKQN
ncbi:MAG TPA: hypothetical protein VH917_04680, partial [Ignavibacteriaceae bacterium]